MPQLKGSRTAARFDGKAEANPYREPSAIYLAEVLSELNLGAGFLDQLTLEEVNAVRRASTSFTVKPDQTVFSQGAPHNGIYLIESGRIRTYYAGPSGKEITLAYWTPGHFVGGPEVFGGGTHMWSATAVEPSRLARLPGPAILQLVKSIPAFAVCLIDGLVAKGKCYSALIQMLGTRSVTQRLASILVILAETEGQVSNQRIAIRRRITHEQLAHIVGSTRQWVTMTLTRFQKQGFISIEKDRLVIDDFEGLKSLD